MQNIFDILFSKSLSDFQNNEYYESLPLFNEFEDQYLNNPSPSIISLDENKNPNNIFNENAPSNLQTFSKEEFPEIIKDKKKAFLQLIFLHRKKVK